MVCTRVGKPWISLAATYNTRLTALPIRLLTKSRDNRGKRLDHGDYLRPARFQSTDPTSPNNQSNPTSYFILVTLIDVPYTVFWRSQTAFTKTFICQCSFLIYLLSFFLSFFLSSLNLTFLFLLDSLYLTRKADSRLLQYWALIILVLITVLTSSMAYETLSFSAAFTRALQ